MKTLVLDQAKYLFFIDGSKASNFDQAIRGLPGYEQEWDGVQCYDEKGREEQKRHLYQVTRGLFEDIEERIKTNSFTGLVFFRSRTNAVKPRLYRTPRGGRLRDQPTIGQRKLPITDVARELIAARAAARVNSRR